MGLSEYQWTQVTVIFSSTVFFTIVGNTVSRRPVPEKAKGKEWLWKNTFVSFIHSCITGTYASICVYGDPKMADGYVESYSMIADWIPCIFLGYVIYDTADMLINNGSRQSLELLLHHFLILSLYGLCVMKGMYLGYTAGALVVEINSSFLHTFQLMRLAKVPRNTVMYRLTSVVNIVSYVPCRFGSLIWLIEGCYLHRNDPQILGPFWLALLLGLCSMLVINVVLFYRLIRGFLRDVKGINREEAALSFSSLIPENAKNENYVVHPGLTQDVFLRTPSGAL